jgi:hypothetical protein
MATEWKGSQTVGFLLGGVVLFLFVALLCLFPLVDCPTCKFYSDTKASGAPGYPIVDSVVYIEGQPCVHCGYRNDAGRISLLKRWTHPPTLWVVKP